MPAKRWPEECNVGSNNTKFLFADRTRYISHLDNIAVPSGAPLFVVFYGEDHISDRGPEVVLNSQLAHALHFTVGHLSSVLHMPLPEPSYQFSGTN